MKNRITCYKSLCFWLFFFPLALHAQPDETKMENMIHYTSLEEALKNPEEVRWLEISNITPPEELARLAELPNLTVLSLRDAHFESLPPVLGSLSSLKVLDLGGNDFKELPLEISRLNNLEEIYLDNEMCLDFQQAFLVLSQMPRLKRLHLENNPHANLELNLSCFKSLEEVYVDQNGTGTTNSNLGEEHPEIDLRLRSLQHSPLADAKSSRLRLFPIK